MKLKIMTYNIAAGRVYKDYTTENPKAPVNINECIEVMKAEMPDILGLNEVDRLTNRSGNVDQPRVIADALGYNYAFSKSIPLAPVECGEYGNAIATRFYAHEVTLHSIPLPEEENMRPCRHYEPRSVIHISLDVEGREVHFLQTHFGLTNEEQVECVKLICRLLDEIGDKPVIFAGDLNATPENPILDPIRERLFDTGTLIDAPYKTYPTHNAESRFLKIDYIFLSSHFKPLSLRVPNANASDHYPYVIEVEF